MEKLESNGRLEKTRHDTYRLNDYWILIFDKWN